MKCEDIKIKKVYRLKKGASVWCIPIQRMVTFNEDETYVEVTARTVFNSNKICAFFGNILEPNIFGVLRGADIQFVVEDIVDDKSEIFKNANTFNKKKKPFIWIDLISKPSEIKKDGEKNDK